MDDFSNIDRLLVDRFAHGNGTVFVGAGVSLASRLPNWKKLMQPLKEDLGRDAESLDSLQIAELYELKHGRSALIRYLKDQLGHVKFRMNRTHELLVSLPVNRIYTTNFDDLLEQASQKKHINRHVISNAAQFGLSDSSSLSIVKLHGDLSDPNSIVITARDFYSYAAKNPAVADLLKVELQTRTILFIGYSFNDPNLAMILGNAAFQAGSTPPPMYSIQFRPKELTVQALKARGISVIAVDAEPGTADADKKIEAWLYQFSRALNRSERRNSCTAHAQKRIISEPLLMRYTYSVKSERVSQRIRNGLSSEFRVIIIRGEAGVGKTHLVADAAKYMLQSSRSFLWTEGFEQIVWVSPILRQNGGCHSLQQIFSSITSQVEGSLTTGESESDGPRNRIESVLQEKRLLIVIEDLDDPYTDYDHSQLEDQRKLEKESFDEIKAWLEEIGNFSYARSRIVVTSRTATLAGFMVDVTRLEKDEAAKMIHEHARAIMLRRYFDSLDNKTEENIIELTRGNPQAIRLALGLINGTGNSDCLGEAIEVLRKYESRTIEPFFDCITAKIWEHLKPDEKACRIIEAMASFPADEWVPSKLLKRTVEAGEQTPSQATIQKCVRFGLMEYDPHHDNYFMHRTVKESLSRQGLTDRAKLNVARTQLACYLINTLSADDMVCRSEIKEPYWNALVRDEFVKIDPYWPIIESLMWWTEDQEVITKFVLLLVHYMDSRFLNGQRLHFVNRVVLLNESVTQRIKALLKIDALGWTYIEEGLDQLALHQIQEGLALLSEDKEDNDLRALASAWRARIYAKQGRLHDARAYIKDAESVAESCLEKYWIIARIRMMAGDVKLMEKAAFEAEALYLEAEANGERYGGEVGYQTDPRIGFALLLQADQDPGNATVAVDKARQRFVRLAENEHILTGRLYGEYGLALISSRENSTDNALHQLRKILKEIASRQGGNNVLLKLAKETYENLVHSKSSLH